MTESHRRDERRIMESAKKSTGSGFLKQGSILALASILVRVIGMIYRIPMANIIGDEGNGVYSAAFEIYNILLIISSYGMPMAVSKMVSAKCAMQKYKDAYRIFRCSMVFSICTGGVMALFVYFGADWLEAKFFAQYQGISLPLRVLAPTIFIVAVLGVFRGLFQGRKTMLPTAVSQLVEQVVNAFVSVAAAYFLMRAHSASADMPAWGAAGGTWGTCLGALSALILLLFIYLLYRPVIHKQERRDRASESASLKKTYKLILITVIPIILSQTVYQLSGIVDVTLFNTVMGAKGFSSTVVSTMQGIYSTKYRLLVSVPIAVSTAIASSMIPSLVSSFTARDSKRVEQKVTMAVRFNMIIAFPSAVGLAVLARPIISLLFPSSDIATGSMLMIIGSSCIIFYALSTVTSAVLQSIDQMQLPVIHSLASLVIHIGIVWALLQFTQLGVYALVVGNVTYPLVVCILNAHSVRKHLGIKQEMTRSFCIPFLASVTMGAAAFIVYHGLHLIIKSNLICLLSALCIAVVVYFVLVLLLKGLTREELYEFPMGRKMSVLAEKFHLI